MRRSESGKGTAKAIFVTLVLASAAYGAFKILPVYVHNYELTDHIHEIAMQATVQRTAAEAVRNEVVSYANDIDLPITRDNVKVTVGSRVTIDIDYEVPIDLKVWTLKLHFTPTAENRQL